MTTSHLPVPSCLPPLPNLTSVQTDGLSLCLDRSPGWAWQHVTTAWHAITNHHQVLQGLQGKSGRATLARRQTGSACMHVAGHDCCLTAYMCYMNSPTQTRCSTWTYTCTCTCLTCTWHAHGMCISAPACKHVMVYGPQSAHVSQKELSCHRTSDAIELYVLWTWSLKPTNRCPHGSVGNETLQHTMPTTTTCTCDKLVDHWLLHNVHLRNILVPY